MAIKHGWEIAELNIKNGGLIGKIMGNLCHRRFSWEFFLSINGEFPWEFTIASHGPFRSAWGDVDFSMASDDRYMAIRRPQVPQATRGIASGDCLWGNPRTKQWNIMVIW